MPFQIPTLKAVAERAAGAFRANLKGSDARLWPNNVAVSAKVMAGAVWESFSFLDFISRQHLAHLAEGVWLERKAFDFGIARLPASYAEGSVVLSGDPSIAVPAGLALVRGDGIEYDTLTGGTTDLSGNLTVSVRARALGRAGNAVPGVVVALATPLGQITGETIVAATGIGGGTETEGDASLRARLLFRLRNPPHGGAAHDYVIWLRELAGVTRVFVDPVSLSNARTTVGVWFLMDDTTANGIPLTADVLRARAHIDGLRPAGALVDVQAPTAVAVAVTISGLNPDTTAVRDAIRAELDDLFRTRMRVATLTEPFTLRVSKIWEAISIATGEDSHTLTLPAADIVIGTGNIPVLGVVTFS
jgi:uncharacterized phage protein gp47/JayE